MTASSDDPQDYLLGKNPMNCPYIVGVHPASPQNPHSALASGGNDIATIDSVPEQEAHVLYGAIVGGPDLHDRFYDVRSDYIQTEAALDCKFCPQRVSKAEIGIDNAPLVALSAYQVLTTQNDPFYVTLDPSTRKHPVKGHGSSGLSKGAIIAIAVIAAIASILLIGLLTWCCRKRLR
jgi:endoglucanase